LTTACAFVNYPLVFSSNVMQWTKLATRHFLYHTTISCTIVQDLCYMLKCIA